MYLTMLYIYRTELKTMQYLTIFPTPRTERLHYHCDAHTGIHNPSTGYFSKFKAYRLACSPALDTTGTLLIRQSDSYTADGTRSALLAHCIVGSSVSTALMLCRRCLHQRHPAACIQTESIRKLLLSVPLLRVDLKQSAVY